MIPWKNGFLSKSRKIRRRSVEKKISLRIHKMILIMIKIMVMKIVPVKRKMRVMILKKSDSYISKITKTVIIK